MSDSSSDEMFREEDDRHTGDYDYVLGGGVSRKGRSPALGGNSPALHGRNSPALHGRNSPALHGRSPALHARSPALRGSPALHGNSPGSSSRTKTEDTLENFDLGQSATAEKEPETSVRVNISTCTQGKPKKPVIVERSSVLSQLKKTAKAKLRLSNKQCVRFFDYTTGLELKDTMSVQKDSLVVVAGATGLDSTSERDFRVVRNKIEVARAQEATRKIEEEKARKIEEEKEKRREANAAKAAKRSRRKKAKKGKKTADSDEEGGDDTRHKEGGNESDEGAGAQDVRWRDQDTGSDEGEEGRLGRSKRRKQKRSPRAKSSKTPEPSDKKEKSKTKTGKGKKKQKQKRDQINQERLQKAREKKERRLAREDEEADKKDELWLRNQASGRDREVAEALQQSEEDQVRDKRWEDNNKVPQRERLYDVRGGFFAERRLKQKFVDKERVRQQRGFIA